MKCTLEKEISSLPPHTEENTQCPEEILLSFAFEQVSFLLFTIYLQCYSVVCILLDFLMLYTNILLSHVKTCLSPIIT